MRPHRCPLLAGLLCAALALPSCAFRAKESSPLGGSDLSIQKEMELTAEIHRQIRAQAEFISDPELLEYLNTLGQRLVAVTEPQPFMYRFSILKSNDLNAFTIGGGYVYISSEVLAQAGDVSELAGVLAHEVAHVRQRHIAKRQENQGLVTLATLAAAAAIALAGGDPSMIAVAEGINVSMQLQNSRQDEAESDRKGVEYMIRAGYDPVGLIRFFERIITASPRRPGSIPPYLFTHPDLKERVADTRVEIARSRPPRDLIQQDQVLPKIQARLALILAPIAGGSGLHARATFDRTKTDPYLERARQALREHDVTRADELLAEAQELEPNDSRVAFERAEIAEERGDLELAQAQLEKALQLDPGTPLLQYRLGLIHKRRGNRGRALFYLEQAAINFNRNSSGRRKAELQLEQLSFDVLEEAGLGKDDDGGRRIFVRGESIKWWGRISSRFQTYNPELRVSWSDPKGRVVREEKVRMSPLGKVSSELKTSDVPLGRWLVTIRMGDSVIDEREFDVMDELRSSGGGG